MEREDGKLAVPDPPPRIKYGDYETDEAFKEAAVRRDAFMKERRKLQQWLHDQGRDRRDRARPSEEAAKLTPEAKRAKSEANTAARQERAKAQRPVHEARRQAKIEARRRAEPAKPNLIAEFMAAERAAAEAAAEERVKEREAREAAAAERLADAAPYPKFYQPPPKWWTDMGKSQELWFQSLDDLKLRREERVAAKANAAAGEHVDCVRCGTLFCRRSPDEVRCVVCSTPAPVLVQAAASPLSSHSSSRSSSPLLAEPSACKRRVCAFCSIQFVPQPSWQEECVECQVAIQQAHKEGMLQPHVSTVGSVGPEDARIPSALDAEMHASGHVEYGEASCPPDVGEDARDDIDNGCLVFRDEAERLAFMD